MDILISGASTGIGRAAAIHMARKGHTVWAGVRSQKSFDDLTRANVQGLYPVYLDICDEKSVSECVGLVKKKAGILHALVNNAGIAVGGPIEGVSIEDWRRQFETNVFGQVRVIQQCLPLLRDSKGRIVNLSSIAGRVSSPFLGPYSASKFALEALSDSLRREVLGQGIRVSLVEPGPIDTPIWDKSQTDGFAKIDQYPQSLKDIYGDAMARFKQHIATAVRTASPITAVTGAIEHALTARNPKTRYLVGRGTSVTALAFETLPDAWLDRLVNIKI